jgi:hypothetical protein
MFSSSVNGKGKNTLRLSYQSIDPRETALHCVVIMEYYIYCWERLALLGVYLLKISNRFLLACFGVNLQRVLFGLAGNW